LVLRSTLALRRGCSDTGNLLAADTWGGGVVVTRSPEGRQIHAGGAA
jgi:hypothetical protein